MVSPPNELKLWRRHATGAVGYWRTWASHPFIMFAYSVTGDGSETVNQELISLNQSGRTWHQQAELEMQSRASRKMQRGYKRTYEEAFVDTATNALGLPQPMLAQRIEKVNQSHLAGRRKWIQPKYDGHRCLVGKIEGRMFAYSRLGTPISTVPHLLEALEPSVPDDVVIDGELYVHGWSLQQIGSVVKRAQMDTLELNYITYDVVDTALHYGDRLALLKDIVRPAWEKDKRLNIAETNEISEVEDAWPYFHRYKAAKYEGAILRLDGMGYQPIIRSKYLLKLKSQMDCEFEILDVYLSDRGEPVMTLKTSANKTFKCTAPGTQPEKHRFLAEKDRHIGRMMTCEFACYTDEGIPFHCVALQIREDI